jgi:hypothetical protein
MTRSSVQSRSAPPARSEKSEGCPPKLCNSRAEEGSQLNLDSRPSGAQEGSRLTKHSQIQVETDPDNKRAPRSRRDMRTVYLIQSIPYPSQHYVGLTHDLEKRLSKHNDGGSPHTAK